MGKSTISVALKGEGIDQVRDAIRSVKHSFIEMDQASLASTDAASKKRIAIMRAEGKVKLALLREQEQDQVRSARSYAQTLNRGRGSSLESANAALTKGEGYEGVLKAAGVAGLAVGALSTAINFASASLKQFASFVINDVIKPKLALETRSQQVANNSGGALTSGAVMGKARAIALKNNMDPMALLNATGRFQDLTGEPQMGFDVLPTIAAISKGRGYDPMALTELSAATYRPGMKSDEMNKLLFSLTAQGEKGSIPIGEFARLGGRATAPAEKLGGDWFTKVTTAGAFLQTAKRTGFGTVDEAAEGFNKFVQEAPLHGKSLSPKSFATVNGVDTIIDPVKYLGDVFRKTRGAGTALHGLGFSDPAQKFISAYTGTFSEGYKGAKAAGKNEAQARDAGASAVEALVNAMKVQTSNMEEEGKRRATVMETDGQLLDKAMADIRASIDKDLGTAVSNFAKLFVDHQADIMDFCSAVLNATGALMHFAEDAERGWQKTKAIAAGDGDVLRSVGDRGSRTELGSSEFEDALGRSHKGYWRKGARGNYELVQGDAGEQKGSWSRVGKEGTLAFNPEWEEHRSDVTADGLARAAAGMRGNPLGGAADIYDYLKHPGGGPTTAMQNQSEAGPQEEQLTSNEADEANAAAAKAAADAHQAVADQADAAQASLQRLTSSLDDITTKFDGLARNQSFMDR